MKHKRKYFYVFVAILVLAFLLRVVGLETFPPGLWPDEAYNGNDGVITLETGDYQLFYEGNNGREGMYFWIIAFLFKLFGVSIASLRLTSALIGFMTVPVFYFLGREIGAWLNMSKRNGRFLGALAMFTLATSHWHIYFSRIAFRAILGPLFLSLAFWLMLKGAREKKTSSLLLSGLFAGAGLYTYIAYRAVLVALVLTLMMVLWASYGKRIKKYIKDIIVWSIGFAASAGPMIYYFVANPSSVASRSSQVSILANENPLSNLALSLIKNIGMFFVIGDANGRHNFMSWPQLGYIAIPFLLVGILLSLKHIFSKSTSRRERVIYISLWLITGAGLAPAFLTMPNENPHSLRAIFTIIPAILLTVIGLKYLIDKLKETHQVGWIVALFIMVSLGQIAYVVNTAPFSEESKSAFTVHEVQTAESIIDAANRNHVYVVTSLPVEDRPFESELSRFVIQAQAPDKNIRYVTKEKLGEVSPDQLPALVIFLTEKPEDIEILPTYIDGREYYEIKSIEDLWKLNLSS